MAPKSPRVTWTTCTEPGCTKRAYKSRRDAKAASADLRQRDHLATYRCGDKWHVGHLPAGVIAGVQTRVNERVDRRPKRGTRP